MANNDWIIEKLKNYDGKLKIDQYDADIQDYLQEISTYHVERLAYEPNRLGQEKSALEEETENLTFSNYKTFVHVADCSKNILKDFVHIHKNVDSLLSTLPQLESECKRFGQEAQKINLKRSDNSLALKKHNQLLEILEIPQVMDTCVRAAYYEEALELAQYMAKLERRLGHIPLIQKISAEVKNQRELLLENLLDQLSTSLNLSTCLKVVSYLRRLNVFTESELRIKFLTLRADWLDNLLTAVPAIHAYEHMTKIIELSRVHLFDIISQYKAAFPDEDYANKIGKTALFQWQDSVKREAQQQLTTNNAVIFPCWLLARVDHFIAILRQDFKSSNGFSSSSDQGPFSASGNRLDSVLTQFMHLGLSLSRIGADIRYLVAPVFLDFIENLICEAISTLSQKFVKKLLDEIEHKPNFSKPNFIKFSSENETKEPIFGDNLEAPISLMQSLSLALYMNGILGIFNNCRSFVPLSLAAALTNNLGKQFADVDREMLEIFDKLEGNKKQNVGSLRELFRRDFISHLNACLSIVFPSKLIADSLGIPLDSVAKLHLNRIDLDTPVV